MMQRVEEGCIDYILVKSISRFSRSASDTLFCLRKLSRLGVGVYFMEQNLDTMSGYGDLIVTLLATIAEMESESIADNMKVTKTSHITNLLKSSHILCF
jgi:DNA invertase Pin-like site-specific DNA recombinase